MTTARLRTTLARLSLATLFATAACGDDTTASGGAAAGGSGQGASAGQSAGGNPSVGGAGGAATGGGGASEGGGGGITGEMTLTSTAYSEGSAIPDMYSCNGANVSPPLAWTAGPGGTTSYAIVFRDLSNMLGHAAIFDIPAATLALPEDVERAYAPADVPGAAQCDAYDGQPGYAGPCPGNQHTYQFTLYAIPSATLGLDPMTASVDDVDNAAQAVALASATLSGTYTPP